VRSRPNLSSNESLKLTAKAVVSLNGVSFSWPAQSQPVLEDLNLTIEAGERLFIRGASGSGKTSLISLIGGLLRPDAGRIEVLGKDLAALTAGQRDRFRADHVGFIFQMFNLVPYLSLVENVLLPCRFSPVRRRRAVEAAGGARRPSAEAERLLKRLQLPESLIHQRRVSELSAGQQQRVAVARALIGRPELIIADEPTSALDPIAREQFIDLLFEECANTGASLLFVSHDGDLEERFPKRLELRGPQDGPPKAHIPC